MAEVATWSYGLAAFAYFFFGLYIFFAWRGALPGGVLFAAVALSFAWTAFSALGASEPRPVLALGAAVFDILRSGAWYAFLIVLSRPLWAGRLRWPAVLAAVVFLFQICALLFELLVGSAQLPLRPVLAAWLAHAIVGLMLVEQLYRSVPASSRWGIKPACLALAAGYTFELYLFADAFLFARLDPDVWAVRGIAHALVIPLIALSGTRSPAWTLRMSVSREVVFHSTALAGAGLYLLVIAGAAYYVRYFGGDWGRALQMTLLFAGLVLLGALLFSGALRARLRVFISKHLFSYRYDYRNEWLRFTQALSSADHGLDLGQSVIRALSDLVESPGGALWLADPYGKCTMHSRLNHPQLTASEPLQSPLCRFLEEREWIVNLEEFRAQPARYEGLTLPQWLSSLDDAWLIIPLKTGERLIGFVVLSVPRTPFEIDWEVLDLLKTAQRQAAGYLDRMLAAEALLEARKFDSFNRMSAFVVHDLKNLVAQLSLMLKNAERHRDNPEFQKDMLETVAHVESRMRSLMTQLQEKRSIDPPRAVDLVALLRTVQSHKRNQHPAVELRIDDTVTCEVTAHPERLERIIGHVVQNALDATEQDGSVSVTLEFVDASRVRVLVEDDGCGMSPEFVRERLSRPFQTTKASGMGIGVFETRQYLEEIGGTLCYDSEIGVGTRVTIELPTSRRAP
ncbi:MAG TPA: PEP-CTERM system histidine kinase PrsK [Thauera sp.]|nr:PEP-CTERM system histidine kinase PrsK [Thauera sp.]HHW63421.1 PEP-CTERM system histidine kinase PrsK [Rhodocyclaceae bacterium]